jgi:hypothetical protein
MYGTLLKFALLAIKSEGEMGKLRSDNFPLEITNKQTNHGVDSGH